MTISCHLKYDGATLFFLRDDEKVVCQGRPEFSSGRTIFEGLKDLKNLDGIDRGPLKIITSEMICASYFDQFVRVFKADVTPSIALFYREVLEQPALQTPTNLDQTQPNSPQHSPLIPFYQSERSSHSASSSDNEDFMELDSIVTAAKRRDQ
ncbi:MAG TPA: hypothetical protein VLE96_00185 [Chlamydiales bacterium]|nr:hypothetical protein [Chlamydiales bacterium]